MEGQYNLVLWFLAAMAAGSLTAVFWTKKKHMAYLSIVRRELKKEKQWLRRGEYNAAMVKGRQNLELLLKSVAEFNGIQIDNTAQDRNNSGGGRNGGGKNGNSKNGKGRNGGGRNSGNRRRNYRGRNDSMTNQEFCRWLADNGHLDRVAKWELNQIRIIGNKAVHENFDSKDEAWNQYNYLEDIFKIFSEQHQPAAEWNRQDAGKDRKKP